MDNIYKGIDKLQLVLIFISLDICSFIFQGPPGSTGPPGPGTPIMPSPQGEPEVTSTLMTDTPGSLSEQDAES